MSLKLGRQGQVYLVKETSYGDEECLSASHAVRHIELSFVADPYNRVTSPEKKQTPGPATRFDRKKSAELSTLVALLRPSGTLNTLAEIDPILEAAFGDLTNVVLSTTVEGSPTPSTTGATVASAGDLAVGDAVLINIAGHPKTPFVRILTVVSGAALTWSPALPAAPSAGDTVKGGITYKLTTDLAISLCVAHYLENFQRELLGVGINELGLAFDSNEEPRVTASGPASEQLTGADMQDAPASFSTVGGQPPSGLIGEMYIDDGLMLFKNMEVTISNGLLVRNQEYGVNAPSEIYRSGKREISISLESFVETEETLYDLTEAGTNCKMLKQTGKTEGNIVAIYAPKVEFKVPETDDADEETNWSYTGLALETADGQNDELTLALM